MQEWLIMQRDLGPLRIEDTRRAETEETDHMCGECGRKFENPIKATILYADRNETFYACPRCMTKTGEIEKPTPETQPSSKVSQNSRVHTLKAEKEKSPKDPNCAHFFGYLRQRPKDSGFPETCLTCERMVDCLMQ